MDEPERSVADEGPRPLYQRLLALAALVALLASAAWSSWAILTDNADFGAPPPRDGTVREADAAP